MNWKNWVSVQCVRWLTQICHFVSALLLSINEMILGTKTARRTLGNNECFSPNYFGSAAMEIQLSIMSHVTSNQHNIKEIMAKSRKHPSFHRPFAPPQKISMFCYIAKTQQGIHGTWQSSKAVVSHGTCMTGNLTDGWWTQSCTNWNRQTLHPGKLRFRTPKWRFGRWFSFSIRWFLGSSGEFSGVLMQYCAIAQAPSQNKEHDSEDDFFQGSMNGQQSKIPDTLR